MKHDLEKRLVLNFPSVFRNTFRNYNRYAYKLLTFRNFREFMAKNSQFSTPGNCYWTSLMAYRATGSITDYSLINWEFCSLVVS